MTFTGSGEPYVCGTDRAYVRHIARGEVTDRACCDAHAAAKRTRRARLKARAEELMGRPVPHREVAHVLGNYGP